MKMKRKDGELSIQGFNLVADCYVFATENGIKITVASETNVVLFLKAL